MIKQYSYSLWVLFFLNSTSFANDIQNLNINDYKITNTFFDEAYLNGQFSLTSPSDSNKDTSYDGKLNGYYKLRNMTLNYAQDFRMDANYDISKSDNKNEDSQDSYNTLMTGHIDKYLVNYNKNLLIYGSGTFGYRKQLGSNSADDPYSQLGTGIGYGRIYDATPYAKSIRILNDLKERNLIDGEITKSIALKLADIISKESEYISKYSLREYKKYWFNDMSKLLKNSNMSKKELDSFGIIRIEEILIDEKIFPRYHGWIIRGGVGKIFSNYDNSGENPTLDVEFEYGKPIGLKSQFFERAKYSTILNDDTGHKFTNTITYSYELTDRIDWENNWIFDYYQPTNSNLEDITTNTLTSTFAYYVANRISLDTTISFKSINDGIDNNGNDNIETKLFIGARYRLK